LTIKDGFSLAFCSSSQMVEDMLLFANSKRKGWREEGIPSLLKAKAAARQILASSPFPSL